MFVFVTYWAGAEACQALEIGFFIIIFILNSSQANCMYWKAFEQTCLSFGQVVCLHHIPTYIEIKL